MWLRMSIFVAALLLLARRFLSRTKSRFPLFHSLCLQQLHGRQLHSETIVKSRHQYLKPKLPNDARAPRSPSQKLASWVIDDANDLPPLTPKGVLHGEKLEHIFANFFR
jgi:hypothetical protein